MTEPTTPHSRVEAIRLRGELEILELCTSQEEQLDAAKSAYAANPTPENLAAMDAAMAEMEAFRSWLRAGAEASISPEPAPKGRVKRGGR